MGGPIWEQRCDSWYHKSAEGPDAESRGDRWYQRSVEAEHKSHWKWQGPVNARYQVAGTSAVDKLSNSASNTWKRPSLRNATKQSDGASRRQGVVDSTARPRFQRPVKRH